MRRDRAVRVRAWLLGLAIVPMLGSGWFALGELHDVRDAREQADAVHELADQLVQLIELQSAVLTEGQYTAVSAGAAALGLDNQAVIDLVGMDLRTGMVDARRRADRISAALDPAPAADLLRTARRAGIPLPAKASQDYKAVDQVIEASTGEILEELLRIAGRSEDAAEVVSALRALERSSVARSAIGRQFLGQFGVRFTATEHAVTALGDMVAGTVRYDAATAYLLRDGTASPEVRQLLSSIHRSRSYRVLRATVDGLVAVGLLDGAAHAQPTIASVLPQIHTISRQINAGFTTVDQHLDLVVAAGRDVTAAADGLEAAADDRTRKAVATVTGLIVASTAFVVIATVVISRPLSRLSESARRLSAGDSSAKLPVRGPREIRDATRALNGAVDNFAWAERQALALADGRFDDPTLGEQAPGAIGASLRQAVTTLTSSLSEREEFRRRLSHETSHDSLTQVANRRSVMAHLERSLARTTRSSSQLAVMFVDVDDFKSVNDLEGHAVGDSVLAATARRLVNSVRQGDQVGRVGGDEFVVVAEPVSGIDEAVRLAERIRDELAAPIGCGDRTVSVGASIGIAIVDSGSDLDADELLRDADLAVYKAKTQGRGQIVVCDEELRAELEQRADLEHALRRALASDELAVHFQPIVDSDGHDPVALEALVRWERPGIGLVPPDSFIPHAERTDLIVDVDRWVLDSVARQMLRWADHEVLGSLPVAVNISARHLGQPDFAEEILDALAVHGIEPSRLIVEVTESALLLDLHRAGVALRALRSEGVQIAIDDFGTGYTSLAHLRALPVDILKIDRSFTSDPAAASLVQLIIDTGHLLGARITAEGIETDDQGDTLRRMGSDELQGYRYGRPVPAATIEEELHPSPAGRMG